MLSVVAAGTGSLEEAVQRSYVQTLNERLRLKPAKLRRATKGTLEAMGYKVRHRG